MEKEYGMCIEFICGPLDMDDRLWKFMVDSLKLSAGKSMNIGDRIKILYKKVVPMKIAPDQHVYSWYSVPSVFAEDDSWEDGCIQHAQTWEEGHNGFTVLGRFTVEKKHHFATMMQKLEERLEE